MGIFDAFSEFRKGRQAKNAQKFGDTLRNMVTTKEQRAEAIEGLADIAGELAVPQLFKRFELVIDHGLQDNREKERVVELLTGHKDLTRKILVEQIKTARRISWLIKVTEKVFDRDEYIKILLDNLSSEFVGFDETVQERNIEIMLALRDVHDPRIIEKLKTHLGSRDEHVRIAALECLEAQGTENETARKILVDMLSRPVDGENARFLSMVKTTAQKHGWI